jgi:hypothetical protein
VRVLNFMVASGLKDTWVVIWPGRSEQMFVMSAADITAPAGTT